MQREAGGPSAWVNFVQALVILSVLALDRVRRAGYTGRWIGENISESYDDVIQSFQSWVDDPVTRRVMLTPEADNVGLGWFQEPDGKLWWVQVLGQSGGTPQYVAFSGPNSLPES